LSKGECHRSSFTRSGNKFNLGESGLADAPAPLSIVMIIPQYINETKSDMRGIKPVPCAIEDDGNLSSGPFPSLEECVTRITQPTNGTTASKLQRGPN
jgi:hypothetical protein